MGGNDFEGVGVTFSGHSVIEANAGAVGREVDGPIGVRHEEVGLRGGSLHLVDEVGGYGEAVAGEVDGGSYDSGPGERAIVLVEIFCTAELAWDAAVY